MTLPRYETVSCQYPSSILEGKAAVLLSSHATKVSMEIKFRDDDLDTEVPWRGTAKRRVRAL